jgi:acyl-CoA thioesterase-1
MQNYLRAKIDVRLGMTGSATQQRRFRYRCIALVTAALVPLTVAGCGESDAMPSSPPIVVDPGSIPNPTPTPTPSPQALSCTVADTVKRADQLIVRPDSGKVGIVAIGSSSTQGVHASSPAATYPAVMQAILDRRGDLATYTVYNAGVGGDNLIGTEARIDRDAVSLKPQLIILQMGTNDAIGGPSTDDRSAFSTRLNSLVARLKLVSSVVLLNGQYYPTQPSNYDDYQNAIDQVSRDQGVAVIDRYALMKSWILSGKYKFTEVLAPDQFHPNDFTYRCMGQIAAELVTKSTVR